ncbi:MAG: tetratricopeptide repeat protein [Planctomycetota bacterium]
MATLLGVRSLLNAKKTKQAQQIARDLRRQANAVGAQADRIEDLLIGITDGTYPVSLDGIALAEIRHAVKQVLTEAPDAASLRDLDQEFSELLEDLPQKTYRLLSPELRSIHEKLEAIAENQQRFLGIAESLLERAETAEDLAAALRSEKEGLERKLAAAIARLAEATETAGGDVQAKLNELRRGDARILLDFIEQQIEDKTDDLTELHLERYAAAFAAIDYPVALDSARILAALHHDDSEAQNRHGMMLFTTGQYPAALEKFREAERLDRKAFGDEHPNVAREINNIGTALESLGQYDAALNQYREAERIDRKAFGSEHPKVAIRVNNIGGALKALGRYTAALDHYREAERIDRKAFGAEHPKVAIRVNNIGGALKALGRYTAALDQYREAERIDRKVFGDEHPKVASDVNNIGTALESLGRYADALDRYREAERIDRKFFGSEHPKVAIRINNIGSALKALGRYTAALDQYRQAERIDRKFFGSEHPKVAMRVNSMGGVLKALGRYDSALSKYREAELILSKFLPTDHPNLRAVRENIEAEVEAQRG